VTFAWGSPARRRASAVGRRSKRFEPPFGPIHEPFELGRKAAARTPPRRDSVEQSAAFESSGVGRSQVHARRLVRLQRSTGDSRLAIRPSRAESGSAGRRFITLRWSTRVVSRFGVTRVSSSPGGSFTSALAKAGGFRCRGSFGRAAFDEASRTCGSPAGALPATVGYDDAREARSRDHVVRGQSERDHRRHQRPAKAVAAQERGNDFEARNAPSSAVRPGKGHAVRRRLGRGRTVSQPIRWKGVTLGSDPT
jgi:hypothetical protein